MKEQTMSGKNSVDVKKGKDALGVLQQMLEGGRISSVKRIDSHLVIRLQNGVKFALEPWGECVLPVQINIGEDTKPYYQGSFSRTEGLVLFERGTLDSH